MSKQATCLKQLVGLLLAVQLASALQLPSSHYATSYLAQAQAQAQMASELASTGAPVISPFAFTAQNVQEGHRPSVLCTILSGDLPVTISWLKDGQLLTPQLAAAKKITIKPDTDQSQLKFAAVRLDHAGNYTCVARNRAGVVAHSAALVVQGEPRWVREPHHEPIVATSGQTIVIDCHTTGWPRPQQTWQIKTHAQREFEPLAATGRISLAANGSLVIRNADKSDEANYLCKSSNGIGRGISWSTSLKVNVPAHFVESNKQQIQIVRKLQQVQLRCDATGDAPITIEWFKNKQRIAAADMAEPRYTIHDEPLYNRHISLLLIKQAQRQDNAIYECVTRNQVGRDRLAIDLLVQEEPDNIQELQATQINSRSVTLMWSEPYDGRSPITNYMFQYRKIHDVMPAAYSEAMVELMDPADLASLMGRAQALPLQQQQQQQHQQQQQFQQQQPQPLLLGAASGSAVSDDWQQASRIVLPVSAPGQPLAGLHFNATQGAREASVKSITIDKLDPSSRYVLRALAVNGIGQSKFSQPMEFSTEEEAPQVSPSNIQAEALNSTSVRVSWDEIPRNKQLGRIHGYYIGYRQANTSAPANFIYKPYLINDLLVSHQQLVQQQQQQPQMQQQQQQQQPQLAAPPAASSSNHVQKRLEFVIHDLKRDTGYEITVVAFNSHGSSPSSDLAFCKTIEMDAPRAVRISIRRESNESIFIEWQRDPLDQSPVDYYELYHQKNGASSESLQVRLPANQTQYKPPGLKCGTRYQFYIIAHNKVGRSPQSDIVSASTGGALPVIPSKLSLIKMLNSTCLLVNLNSFQDNGCRIKTFTIRYRGTSPASASASASLGGSDSNKPLLQQQQAHAQTASGAPSMGAPLASGGGAGELRSSQSLTGANGLAPLHQALKSAASGGTGSGTGAGSSADWITIQPKSNVKHQRANEEDRMEYLCDLNPIGQYVIQVAALNELGRSEIEYTVLMSSDELRYSTLREIAERLAGLPNLFAYIPSVIVFLLAGLFLALVSLILYTTSIKYYQKFVIMHNQMRASRRAKQDEKRRRKFGGGAGHAATSGKHPGAANSNKFDLWADEYEEEEDDGDDETGDTDTSSAESTSGPSLGGSSRRGRSRSRARNFASAANMATQTKGHYMANISNSGFDNSSLDDGHACNSNNKFNTAAGSSCLSTASTDSLHGRFQCLSSKQYVRMNEYTMLPTISANLGAPHHDIYGTQADIMPATLRPAPAPTAAAAAANQGIYHYSTLRRPTMQTYRPHMPPPPCNHLRMYADVRNVRAVYSKPCLQSTAGPVADL